ncbi:MAG: oligosaccharide flippase family protein [Pseudomonadota bacterium]
MDVSSRLKTGAIWTYLTGGVGAIISFVSGIIMARLLEPSDFGVFFTVTAFTAILSRQITFGIPEALLQARELREEQWNTAFWVMTGIALFCGLIVLSIAEPLGRTYDAPEYATVMRFMAIGFLAVPFMSINGTLLRREMRFDIVSRIILTGGLLSAIAGIAAAYFGMGVFSLVIGGLTGVAVQTTLMARAAPWRPRFAFNASGAKPLFSYGWRMHLNRSIDVLGQHLDVMLVGRLQGMTDTGLYNRARSLARLPVAEVLGRLYQVAFSGFSRIQDDLDHTRSLFGKLLCTMAMAIYPMLVIGYFCADAALLNIYGEKWLMAADPMRIMIIGSFAATISVTLGSLLDAQNLMHREIPVQIFNLFLLAVAVLIGSNWGLVGIAVASNIRMLVIAILLFRVVHTSHVKMTLDIIAAALAPATITAIVTALLMTLVQTTIFDSLAVTSIYWLLIAPIVVGLSSIACFYALRVMWPTNSFLASAIEMMHSVAARGLSAIGNRMGRKQSSPSA